MKRALAARKVVVRGLRAGGRVAAAVVAAVVAAVTGEGGITKPVYLRTSVVPRVFDGSPKRSLVHRI